MQDHKGNRAAETGDAASRKLAAASDDEVAAFMKDHGLEVALLATLDNFAALAAIAMERGDLTEGQLVSITGLDRLALREIQDRGVGILDARGVRPEWRATRKDYPR